MADLVRYQTQALAQQQREQIEHIVQVTKAAQQELSRIHTEGARLAVDTLTYTRERIQTAAAHGMSQEKVAALVEEQKAYLRTVEQIAGQGSAALTSIVHNLPALPDSNRR